MNYKNKKNLKTQKNKKRNNSKTRKKNSKTRKNEKRVEIPNISLLKKLCSIHSPSGQEEKTMDFLVNYVKIHKHSWAVQPKVIHNDDLKNNLILVFGKNPKNVIMMHMDSIGYIYAGENSKLYRIGGVEHINKAELRGFTPDGKELHAEVKMKKDINNGNNKNNGFNHKNRKYPYPNKSDKIPIGTNLTFVPRWKETNKAITASSLDNKVGVYLGLLLAKTLKSGILVFTGGEEEPHANSIKYITKLLYDRYKIKNVIIMDTTTPTETTKKGRGSTIVFRDYYLYKRAFLNYVLSLLPKKEVQIEVGVFGSSDMEGVLTSPYPINAAFLGTIISNIHSNKEHIYKSDILSTLKNIKILMDKL